MDFYTPKSRRIIITGHFGSGKTTVAINLALALRAESEAVTLADMDIVNPYFRTADAVPTLEKAGVRCVIPPYASSNVDVPALPAEIYSMFASDDLSKNKGYNIFDVGGDDSGSAALGMFSHLFKEHGYEMLYIASKYRPLTADENEAAILMRAIEKRSRLSCTAVVNNSSVGAETEDGDFLSSFEWAKKLSAACGLPIAFHSTLLDISVPGIKIFHMNNYTKNIYGGQK